MWSGDRKQSLFSASTWGFAWKRHWNNILLNYFHIFCYSLGLFYWIGVLGIYLGLIFLEKTASALSVPSKTEGGSKYSSEPKEFKGSKKHNISNHFHFYFHHLGKKQKIPHLNPKEPNESEKHSVVKLFSNNPTV